MSGSPDYRCPGCNEPSGMVIGPTQAFCTNEDETCKVITFDPSQWDGGLSNAGVIDMDLVFKKAPDGQT